MELIFKNLTQESILTPDDNDLPTDYLDDEASVVDYLIHITPIEQLTGEQAYSS